MQSRRSLLSNYSAAVCIRGGLSGPFAQLGAEQSLRNSSARVLAQHGGTAEPCRVARQGGACVDFWTYSCINCRRTVRYLNRWEAECGGQGLQVVGIHTPSSGSSTAGHNVADALREFGIRYPVGQDNGFRTWRAWATRRGLPSTAGPQRQSERPGSRRRGPCARVGSRDPGPARARAIRYRGRAGRRPGPSQIRTREIYFGRSTRRRRTARSSPARRGRLRIAGGRPEARTKISSTEPGWDRRRRWCSAPYAVACAWASPPPSFTWLPPRLSRRRCA